MSNVDLIAFSDHDQPKNAVREKIMGFADLPDGWEHGVGVPAAEKVIRKALRILDGGQTLGLKADAFVGADGSIAVVFYLGSLSLETTVHTDNSLDISLEDGIGLDFNEVAHVENASFQDVVNAILDLASIEKDKETKSEEALSEIGPKASEERRIKLFLASSSGMKEERERVELLIAKENRRLCDRNIFLNLVIWEDLKQSFQGDRIQDYINEVLLEYDVVIFTFWNKVGDFTKEEFDVAYQRFKEGKKPRYLYVLFKSTKVDVDEIDEEILKIKKLKKEIEGAEQIYKSFQSNEDLVSQLKDQLALIIKEMTA